MDTWLLSRLSTFRPCLAAHPHRGERACTAQHRLVDPAPHPIPNEDFQMTDLNAKLAIPVATIETIPGPPDRGVQGAAPSA